jgi:hypothetical protein
MKFVNTIAGGGKTYAATACAAIRANRYGFKYIIAQPSQVLIDQTLASVRERFPELRCAAIHSGTDPQRVIGSIITHMKGAARRKDGEILLVTHAAIARLPEGIRRAFGKHWNLIVDEVPSATGRHVFTDLLTGIRRSLRVTPQGLQYGRVEVDPNSRWLVKRIANRKAVVKAYQTDEMVAFASDLLNPHVSVYVSLSQWSSNQVGGQMTFFTLLEPSVFDGFGGEPTVMSACFRDTLLYRLWTLSGVGWKEHKGITSQVRASEHTNGKLLTIYYAVERDWSKRLRDAEAFAGANRTVQEVMCQKANEMFGKDQVYLVNRDKEEIVSGSGTKLPNSPHGLNEFGKIDNAVVYSALNLRPDHIKFLDSRGVSSDEIRGAITYQATYQAVLRTSLRDVDSISPKHIVVQDRGCAEYIAKQFPGCQVRRLDAGIEAGQTKTAKGRGRNVVAADRLRDYRTEKKLKHAVGVELVNGGAEKSVHTLNSSSLCTQNSAPLIGMSLFSKIGVSTPCDTWSWRGEDDFIGLLRSLASARVAEKKDNALISPSIFDPHLAVVANDLNVYGKPKKRARVNVVSAIGIWLDNDGGDMSIEEFVNLFPQLRIVIYNSFNSTPEKKRWRVFIPTSHAMTAELYMYVANQIKQVVEQAGDGYRCEVWLCKWIAKYRQQHGREPKSIPFKLHGFDWSKTYPENLMYLPSLAGDARPEASFFFDFNGGLRQPLDVLGVIEHPLINERPEIEPLPVELTVEPRPVIPEDASESVRKLFEVRQLMYDETREHRKIAAINDWRNTPTGLGNREFCGLGIRLKHIGYSLQEIRNILLEEAQNGNSPEERKTQIKNIIDWIRRKGI